MDIIKKNKCNFWYQIKDNTIIIHDNNDGFMSVTNDIENVIDTIREELCQKNNINISAMTIIYEDSTHTYDGVKVSEEGFFRKFYLIREKDMDKAIKKSKEI